MQQTNSPDESKNTLQRQNDQQHTHESPPRNWIIRNWKTVASVGGLFTVAGVGVALLDWASRAIDDVAVALNFFAQNTFSLLIFLAVIVQAVISNRQWRAMRDSVDRTDTIIENMQGQLTSMQNQEKTMQGQLDAMERQWQGSLTAIRPIVEIVIATQPPKNIVFALRNIGKSRASVQFSYKITLGNRVVLSGEIPQFEIDISGQGGHGQWSRTLTTSMTDDEAAVANGPLSERVSLKAEVAGRYWWEADSYPISICRKQSGVTGNGFDINC